LSLKMTVGKTVMPVENITQSDPFKMDTGGFIDMRKIKRLPSDDSNNIGTAFAAETNQRDEDAEM